MASTATAATFLCIAHAASRRDDSGFKLSVIVQGDRLCDGLRVSAIDLDALLDQSSQNDAIDAAVQHGVDFDIVSKPRLLAT